MEKVIFQGGYRALKRAPLPEVRRRERVDRMVMHFGLGLNALVICIIIHAFVFLV